MLGRGYGAISPTTIKPAMPKPVWRRKEEDLVANQLNRLLENDKIPRKNRERASQILSAVEGLTIWEARELLGACADVLEGLAISYRTQCTSTAQQSVDDAFVDEIAGKLAKRLCEAAGGTSQAYVL